MATLYKTSGEVEVVLPQKDGGFSLEELREHIECDWVEMIGLPDGRSMWIDEHGKLKDGILNVTATAWARHNQFIFKNDYIMGNVLVCSPDEVR